MVAWPGNHKTWMSQLLSGRNILLHAHTRQLFDTNVIHIVLSEKLEGYEKMQSTGRYAQLSYIIIYALKRI